MKRYSVNVKTAPAAEPLTLVEAKAHLRVDVDDDDDLIEGLIVAAREWTENYCRRSWVRRTLELRLDCFYGEIKLPRSPVSSVTSVKYTGQDGTLQTVDSAVYQVDTYATPPRIVPVLGAPWPVPKIGAINAVLIEYEAGFAPGQGSPTDYAENVPKSVKSAMKLVIGHLYEHRELTTEDALQMVPFATKSLLAAYEIRDFSLES